MRIESISDHLVVGLEHEEVCSVRDGNTVSERAPIGTLAEGAKVAVKPMRDLEPDDTTKFSYTDERLSQGLAAKPRAILFSNGDLDIYFHDVTLADARITRKNLPLSLVECESEGQVQHQLPREGIVVKLGDFSVVNVPDYFPA
jgi:hypothetical protein